MHTPSNSYTKYIENENLLQEMLVRKLENEIKDIEDILLTIAINGNQSAYNAMYELLTFKKVQLKGLTEK